MTRRVDSRATRQGLDLAWSLAFTLPDGGRGRATLKSEEDAAGLRYTVFVTAETALDLDAIEFIFNLPHAPFVKGALTADAAPPIPLALVRAAGPVLYHADPSTLPPPPARLPPYPP